MDHIDLLAEYESISFINKLQRTSQEFKDDEEAESRESKSRSSIQEFIQNLETISKPKLTSAEFERLKNTVMEKIANSLLKSEGNEYKFLDYLQHSLTSCVQKPLHKKGCPMYHCKMKKMMDMDEFAHHFFKECKRVMYSCSLCKEQFRLPWVKNHDCRRVYMQRLASAEMTHKEITEM
jgi:hypothetical protein